MLVSHKWLQEYIEEKLPKAEEVADLYALHAFEVEGIETKGDDAILDIDVLPNRAHDALSYIGMAREIAVLGDLTFQAPEVKYEVDESLSTDDMLEVSVEDGAKVPRVMKRIITDIQVGESPDWLKEKLESVGQKSINNVVDITNFVMLETGQPLHAFDYGKISGDGKKKIFVRGAEKGESVTTLDGDIYELEEGMLVWADETQILDVAGIKGGVVSGVDENTTTIMLSVCNFEPVNIRKTSRRLGLLTDASKRYEQGITPELTAIAVERASQLLSEIADGKVAHDVIDIYPRDLVRTAAPYKIGVSLTEINNLLGLQLTDSDVQGVLDRFVKNAGFSYEIVNSKEKILKYAPTLEGVPYKWGASVMFDSPRAFDCSSFINHVFVQAGIAIPRMTINQYVFGESVSKEDLTAGDVIFSLNTHGEGVEDEIYAERLGKKTKAGSHFEKTTEFMSGTELDARLDHNGIYLDDGKIMHATKRQGKVVVENLEESSSFEKIVGYRRMIHSDENRYVVTVPYERLDLRAGNGFMISGIKQDMIEEIGRVYGYNNIPSQPLEKKEEHEVNPMFYLSHKIRDVLVGQGFSEVSLYTFGEEGDIELLKPMASDKSRVRKSLVPGLIDNLTFNTKYKDLLGVQDISVFEIGTVFPNAQEHIALGIASTQKGDVTTAVDALEKALGMKMPIEHEKDGIVEINLTKLLESAQTVGMYDELQDIDTTGMVYEPISQYPFVLRDIAVWVPKELAREALENIISDNAGALLSRIDLFDEYHKDDRVSYAYHLVFQSHEKTLSDDEVNEHMKNVEEALKKQEGFEMR